MAPLDRQNFYPPGCRTMPSPISFGGRWVFETTISGLAYLLLCFVFVGLTGPASLTSMVGALRHDMSEKWVVGMRSHQEFMNNAYQCMQAKLKNQDKTGYAQLMGLITKKMDGIQLRVKAWSSGRSMLPTFSREPRRR